MEILDTFNVKIVNDPVYCNICIGQSFVNFSDLTFFVFQPMLLFQYGYDSVSITIIFNYFDNSYSFLENVSFLI